jgi:uncharacterized membrane protein YagU involved in acid resistance
MPTATRPVAVHRGGAFGAILIAWIVAGTMDVTAAVTYYPMTANVTATQILQGIASGLLGAQAFQGGTATAALGLGLHYVIAFVWTVFFYVLASNIRMLTRHPLIVGPVYGTFVWLVMNLVVLPLSNVAHRPLRLQPSIVGAVILMICIGTPIAAIVGRHLSLNARR